MGGEIYYNSLNFEQKFNYAKINLQKQSKNSTLTTAAIVNEIVRLSKNNQKVYVDNILPHDVFEKTSFKGSGMSASDSQNSNIPEDVRLFISALSEITDKNSDISENDKELIVNFLSDTLDDLENNSDEIQMPLLVYDGPEIDNKRPEPMCLYDGPEIVEEEIAENEEPNPKTNYPDILEELVPDTSDISENSKKALIDSLKDALKKLNND